MSLVIQFDIKAALLQSQDLLIPIVGSISTLLSHVALLSSPNKMWSVATVSSTQPSPHVLPSRIPSVLLDLNSDASHIHIVNTSLAKCSMQLKGNWDETCVRFWSELLVLLGTAVSVEMNVKLLMEINKKKNDVGLHLTCTF